MFVLRSYRSIIRKHLFLDNDLWSTHLFLDTLSLLRVNIRLHHINFVVPLTVNLFLVMIKLNM